MKRRIWMNKLLHILWQLFLTALLLLILTLSGCTKEEEPSTVVVPEARINIHVKDLTPPIIQSDDEYTLHQGDAFRLQDHVKVVDNMDGDIGYQCEGSFDTNKSGQYILLLSAKDQAGNEVKKNITIHVMEAAKAETSSPKPPENMESEQPQTKKEIYSRDYLYTDGYSISSASAACSNDLHASGRSGRCDPIMNPDGIYTGVHLELY